jgi:hypothetical protein
VEGARAARARRALPWRGGGDPRGDRPSLARTFMTRSASLPISVPAVTAARSMSPVARWHTQYSSTSLGLWVPLPQPARARSGGEERGEKWCLAESAGGWGGRCFRARPLPRLHPTFGEVSLHTLRYTRMDGRTVTLHGNTLVTSRARELYQGPFSHRGGRRGWCGSRPCRGSGCAAGAQRGSPWRSSSTGPTFSCEWLVCAGGEEKTRGSPHFHNTHHTSFSSPSPHSPPPALTTPALVNAFLELL